MLAFINELPYTIMNENNKVERRIFVKIRFYKNPQYPPLAETVYYKDDMDINFFMRWKWFFLYREALLRVQNPRAFVELTHGPYDYCLPEEAYRKKVYHLLIAAKRKLAQFRNRVDSARRNWDELFPMEEHPAWIKAREKTAWYENRVITLTKEYELIGKL